MTETDLTLDIDEMVKLGAVNSQLYCQMFHSRTVRQVSPPYEKEIWERLDSPTVRFLELMMFRGAAKTSRLRLFAAKRIAYGLSRTILFVGASERDAIRSVTWVRNQVDRNPLWSDAFGLRPGSKWEETQIEIAHKKLDHPIWILGAGITGSLRGINFDDYRPDLILVDDPQNDETAKSLEQREQLENLILGAVANSLAPAVDEPNAKMVMSITPQHKGDVAMKAKIDPQWHSLVAPCWTPETLYLDVDRQESIWPERFPSEELRTQKRAAIKRNKLSIFLREMECRIGSPETAKFRVEWLNYYERKPVGGYTVCSVDPLPMPSELAMKKGIEQKDFEAICVWSRFQGNYYLLDYVMNRGHDPSWTLAKIFEFRFKYRFAQLVAEGVAYQQTLKWIVNQEQQRRKIYFPVKMLDDKMNKFARIENAMNLATEGKLYVHPTQSEFISSFEGYPNIEYFDLLDAAAMGLTELSNPYLEQIGADGSVDDSDVEDFPLVAGACP